MKPNPLLARIQAKHEADLNLCRKVSMQFMEDMTLITMNRVFSAGPTATERFLHGLDEIMREYAHLVVDDTPDAEYSKAKLDEILKPIMGHNFQPYNVRYGVEAKK